MVDVAGREPGEFAAHGGDAESLIGLGNYRDLVVFALLFRERFAEVESDLPGTAFELIVAGVGLAEQHEDGALVAGDLRDALIAGREQHEEFGGVVFGSCRDGHVFGKNPTGVGGWL